MRVNGQGHAPTALPLGERARFHCSGDCMGPRPGMEKRKPLVSPGFEPRDRPARTESLYRQRYPGPQ